ncbi:MAG: hypothetical protein SPJ23_07795, partial [Eubacteriales bacterium]|nr:hypothetical protein [Eubacteriales bacterium]
IFDDGIVTHFVALSNSFLKKICVCGQNSVQKNEKVRLLYGRLSCCRLFSPKYRVFWNRFLSFFLCSLAQMESECKISKTIVQGKGRGASKSRLQLLELLWEKGRATQLMPA